jgi:hypothetical protein
MRALAMDEVGFVSGGENHRPWNPYENFRDVEPSKKFLEMEHLINAALRQAGLDCWGNLSSEGVLIYSTDGSVNFLTPLEWQSYFQKNPITTTTTITVTFGGVTFIHPDGTKTTVAVPPN